MLYLEDYLEMIEHLPQELRDRFTEMREMDLQVHNAMDNLDEQVKQFFANAKRMRADQKEAEYNRIKQEYMKTLEDAEEKVHIANQIYELVEKYLKRLDQELQKFKIELEADNAGITEILEKRSLELDNPPQTVVNHIKERRKHNIHNNVNAASSVANSSIPNDTVTTGSSTIYVTNNIGSNRSKSNSLTPLSALVSGANNNTNGNLLLSTSLNNTSASPVSCSSANTSAVLPHPSPLGYIGAGNTAIAAAASQAIAATQQMQQGRRTASLKASYEAINAGLQTISCDFNPLREGPVTSTVNSGILNNGEGPSTGLQRATKRSRTSSQFHDTDESSEAPGLDGNGEQNDWTFDPNEPRYCLCNQVSYGDMVACDNADCQYEWFHYGCVGITQPPKGKWFCPSCNLQMKKKSRKEKS
ncbi:Inhibitor of growth protein 3-like protein [Dinothrombium tinctorium]|uniref:Inhibitor of growth protein n=1 Tax=Dinothrombium tinctorium TaxID=1965070 RepID=A0A3S3PQW3_9ACAR|nr:Inhibitor of growth protein 3-like protein [Dinothrombium tinctorium]RWS14765.1 Inhibitor of growth protein 3-like protein [Dinothrombium tinctorium]RWS14871.1 Inhibitor of growth protein 3-like protein [Dinothrombium tinctorium]